VSTVVVDACVQALHKGAIGGGCVCRFDGKVPIWIRIFYPVAYAFAHLLRLVGGQCLFCSRDNFEAVGGFSERYYAAEEADFIKQLKGRGSFVVPKPRVLTSGRKLRMFSTGQILRECYRWFFKGPESYRSREGLEIWYDQNSEFVSETKCE